MTRLRHDEAVLLDAARSVVLERGVRGATLAAVAEQSRAPTGSIYHRFGSVDEMLARAWIRAARRSHACLFASDSDDPLDDVVATALAMYDFCIRAPDDALLLATFRPADFARARLPGDVRSQLEDVNAPLTRPLRALARRAFGRGDRIAIDLLLLATVDLPYAFVRRHLEAGARPPAANRRRLGAAVRAMLAEHAPEQGSSVR